MSIHDEIADRAVREDAAQTPRSRARAQVLERLAGTLEGLPRSVVDALTGDRDALYDLLVDAYITGRIDAVDAMRADLRDH